MADIKFLIMSMLFQKKDASITLILFLWKILKAFRIILVLLLGISLKSNYRLPLISNIDISPWAFTASDEFNTMQQKME